MPIRPGKVSMPPLIRLTLQRCVPVNKETNLLSFNATSDSTNSPTSRPDPYGQRKTVSMPPLIRLTLQRFNSLASHRSLPGFNATSDSTNSPT